MTDPFLIHGPAKISFSGGRTSALLLHKVLEAGLQPDVHVVFANTGKERPETLDFVNECSVRWGVPVHWVEREPCSCLNLGASISHQPGCPYFDDMTPGFREVGYLSASRDGTPFKLLVKERNFLPNPVTRFCTQELKIRVMKKWMLAQGYDHWTNVIGLRADEPRRVARIRSSSEKDLWDIALPLAEAGITVADVDAFWTRQGFDLGLEKWEGNCDLCFLKGRAKRTRIMRDDPSLAPWWIDMEHMEFREPPRREYVTKVLEHSEDGTEPQPMLPLGDDALRRIILPKERRYDKTGQFRYDVQSYANLLLISQHPMLEFDASELEGEAVDDIGDCFCNAG